MSDLAAELETQSSVAPRPVPKPVPASKVKGVDVSSWQHPNGAEINWAAVRAGGIDFVMIKASQGDNYQNPYFAGDCHGAHTAGLIVGAYHFFESGAPADKQAEVFLSALVGHVLELGVYLDWEPGPMPDYQVLNEYAPLLAAIEETRKPCGLYCDESWLETFRRLNLPIHKLWLGEWSGLTGQAGVTIVQTLAAPVAGIEGDTDTDLLLVTRGVNIPRPVPLQVAPVHEVADEPAAESTEENVQPVGDHTAEVTEPPTP